jgi:arylsulfatase
MSRISRRDFLKLNAALAGSVVLSNVPRILSSAHSVQANKPNILVFVFDALSARHMSLYGYPRRTTPNLERFADRAFVYHKHFSAGNFTTTGTASMLTGLYPWTHRAFNYRAMIDRSLTERNLFNLIGDGYTRLAFTQNPWADILLSQFEADLDFHLPCDLFTRVIHSLFQPDDLPRDRSMAYYVFQDFLNLRSAEPHPFPGSLFVGSVELARELTSDRNQISVDYPRGLPTVYEFSYENAAVFAGIGRLAQQIASQSSPCLAYFHLWSPHGPYNVHRNFVDIFQDDLKWNSKPRHPLAGDDFSLRQMSKEQRAYDESIAEVDAEFGRVMTDLEGSGVLRNSYVIVTSDHGELFERGEIGHASALMYAPVTHIPLLISAPGQDTRSDIHTLTSNLDLLPTLLKITGKDLPNWIEGRLLPGFGGIEENSRSIFPLIAKDNAVFRSIEHGTFSMIQGPYELFFFTGYPDHSDRFELYDLEEDPHELQDLFEKDINTASQMKDELLEAVHAANRNYQKKND